MSDPSDDIRYVVRCALVKDGWAITHDPYKPSPLTGEDFQDAPDVRPIAADRGSEKVALILSRIQDFDDLDALYSAIGAHAIHRSLMARCDPDRAMLLAISEEGVSNVMIRPLVQLAMGDLKIPLAVYDRESRGFVRWDLETDGIP